MENLDATSKLLSGESPGSNFKLTENRLSIFKWNANRLIRIVKNHFDILWKGWSNQLTSLWNILFQV